MTDEKPVRTQKEARLDKENEDTLSSIKNNEWHMINSGLNLARLNLFNYFVTTDGKIESVNRDSVQDSYDYFVKQIEQRAKETLMLKDRLTPERLSKSEEFNTQP